MNNYWVEWADGTSGCMYGKDQVSVLEAAVAHKPNVKSVIILPYPANPQIGEKSPCPPFCWKPNECKGKTSCPRSYACSE